MAPSPSRSPAPDLPARLLAVGRLDGDARVDVALTGALGIHALLGQDPWPPSPAPILAGADNDSTSLRAGDLNEDGVDDLVVVQHPVLLLLSNP